MKKLLKTVILIPMFPLIALGLKANPYSQCRENAEAMLRWRKAP